MNAANAAQMRPTVTDNIVVIMIPPPWAFLFPGRRSVQRCIRVNECNRPISSTDLGYNPFLRIETKADWGGPL
jgi:hypothetical protein